MKVCRRTPYHIIQRLYREIIRIQTLPDVLNRLHPFPHNPFPHRLHMHSRAKHAAEYTASCPSVETHKGSKLATVHPLSPASLFNAINTHNAAGPQLHHTSPKQSLYIHRTLHHQSVNRERAEFGQYCHAFAVSYSLGRRRRGVFPLDVYCNLSPPNQRYNIYTGTLGIPTIIPFLINS